MPLAPLFSAFLALSATVPAASTALPVVREAKAVREPAKLQVLAEDESLRALVHEHLDLLAREGVVLRRLPDGRRLLLAIGSCGVRNRTDADALRQRRVALARARASLVEYLDGARIDAERESKEVSKASADGVAFRRETVEWFRSSVHGGVHACPELATWESSSGDRFYVAIGGVYGKAESSRE